MFPTATLILIGALVLVTGCVDRPDPPPRFDRSFAIEIDGHQSERDIRSTSQELFERVVSVEPLFPDVDPADDPLALARIYRLRVAGASPAGTPWDAAYALQERGRFANVEPDSYTTLPEDAPGAASVCMSDGGLKIPKEIGWAPAYIRLNQSRALTPPPGGKQRGEGVRVCHPDTGWTDHVDLDGSQVDTSSGLNLMEGGTNTRDPLGYRGSPGHGTATGSVLISAGELTDASATLPPGSIVGVAPGATLVPIRAMKSVIHFLDSDIAKAVRHAAMARCDVISLSLGGNAFFGLKRAIDDAARRGVVVAAAAGNCVGYVVAPASYSQSVAVAATNFEGKPWRGSSRGRAVAVSAPGENVYAAKAANRSAPVEDTYRGKGTSFAAAEVAGGAALWLGFHGRDAIQQATSGGTVRDLFVMAVGASAYKPPAKEGERGSWDSSMGAGILDLEKLLKQPLSAATPSALRRESDDTLSLLSRMFDIERERVRSGVAQLLGNPDDLEAELRRYGPELLDIAAGNPDAFRQTITSATDGSALSTGRDPSVDELRSAASRALSQRMKVPQ